MKRLSLHVPALLLMLVSAISLAATDVPVSVTDAFVQALPPTARNTSAYMNITNTSDETVVLIGADSPAADSTMLHRSTSEGGMMSMEHVDSITIPAGGSVALEPGGLHLMLMGLTEPLAVDSFVEVTLQFDNGMEHSLILPVRRLVP